MASVPAIHPKTAVPCARRRLSGCTRAGSACKSLLISRSPHRTPSGTPAGQAAGAVGQVAACIFLLIPRRAGLNWAADGLARRTATAPHKSAVSIVEACRSLLIHRPCAEPVRSGGDRARPDGHRLPRRPPSRLIESGGRR
jgi:hypothetical protein